MEKVGKGFLFGANGEVIREGPSNREHQVLELDEELVILFKSSSVSLCLGSWCMSSIARAATVSSTIISRDYPTTNA